MLRVISICIAGFIFEAQATLLAEELSGRVTWPGGRAAPGVTMTIGPYSVTTAGDGRYKFDFLGPGSYVLTIGVPGRRSNAERVTVNRGQNAVRDFEITW